MGSDHERRADAYRDQRQYGGGDLLTNLVLLVHERLARRRATCTVASDRDALRWRLRHEEGLNDGNGD